MEELPPLKEFAVEEVIANFPPGEWYQVNDLLRRRDDNAMLFWPPLYLHCDNEHCEGLRFWDCDDEPERITYWSGKIDLELRQPFYVCRHCCVNRKIFSLALTRQRNEEGGRLLKIGQIPQFGPHTPTKLANLLGSERDYFFKGRRAEAYSLGIAAFSYYRRVVEARKDRLFSEIIRVAQTVGSPPELIATLRKASKEVQFNKAIAEITPAVPESLLMKGHNPLTLLHSALSQGLHSDSDEECLELARDIRVVLAELAERMDAALQVHKELDHSVGRLIAKHVDKKSQPKTE